MVKRKKQKRANKKLAKYSKSRNAAKTIKKKKLKVIVKVRKSILESKAKIAKKKEGNKLKKLEHERVEIKMKQLNHTLSSAAARQLLIAVGGENALAVIRSFSKNISDEELSKKLKMRISDIRATLNKLHNEGIVNYNRERDSESGWYSYSWSLNAIRLQQWIEENCNEKKLWLYSSGDHYFCSTCGLESTISFEKAIECQFKCVKCSHFLEFIDWEKAYTLSNLNNSNNKEKIGRK